MNNVYTKKQLEFMNELRAGKLKRINILEGSVRSGKTYISLVAWFFYIASMPKDKSYIMVAKTLTSLRRNILDLLVELVGKNFTYSLSKKEGRLFGRLIYLEGVNDTRAESKIRGMTLQGAYCDELTLFSEEFFKMLLTRLSDKNAKLFATTNPDTPNHWLKTKYLDNQDLSLTRHKFLLEDNTFLEKEYIENIKKENRGVFYDRFILGEWVLAEGLVYQMFDKEKHVTNNLPETGRYFISIDYGTQNPFVAGLWCLKDDKAYQIDEYYYSGKKTQKPKTDEEYYNELVKLAGDRYIEKIIIDPSASSFIECIKRHGLYSVRRANNDVLNGIRRVSSLLEGGKLKFSSRCKNTINEFMLYSWEEDTEKERPIKENDHAMDEVRYFVNTIMYNDIRVSLYKKGI